MFLFSKINRLQIISTMKNKDEENHRMLENNDQDVKALSKKISTLEHQLSVQSNTMSQQLEEMHNYCKFFASLYSDLKLNFVQTKHVLLSKIVDAEIEVPLENIVDDEKSEKIKELQEEVQKLKLENEVLKTKLILKHTSLQNEDK